MQIESKRFWNAGMREVLNCRYYMFAYEMGYLKDFIIIDSL